MFFKKLFTDSKNNKNNKKQEQPEDIFYDYKKMKTSQLNNNQPVAKANNPLFSKQETNQNDIIKNNTFLNTEILINADEDKDNVDTNRWSRIDKDTSDNNISKDTQSYLENQNTKVLLDDDLKSMMQEVTNITRSVQSMLNEEKLKTKPINDIPTASNTKILYNKTSSNVVNNLPQKTEQLKQPVTAIYASQNVSDEINLDSLTSLPHSHADLRIRKINKRDL